MNKETFLTKLTEALSFLEPAERDRTVQYYREILEDQIEEGTCEEDAVAGMEPVEEIAARFRAENTPASKEKRSGWTTAFVIAGFPLWFPLLLAAAAVFLSLLAAFWAIALSLFVLTAALSFCLPAGIGCLLLMLSGGYPLTGVFLLGACLVCAALGIALFFPTLAFSKLLLKLTVWPFRTLWHRFFLKKGVSI